MTIALLEVIAFSYIYYRLFKGNYRSKSSVIFFSAIVVSIIVQYVNSSGFFSEYKFTKHLLAESVIYFGLMPIIVKSLPKNHLRYFFWNYKMKKLQIFINPFISIAMFFSVFFITHLPFVLFKIIDNQMLFIPLNLLLMTLSALVWFPFIINMQEYKGIKPMSKLMLLLTQSFLLLASYLPIRLSSFSSSTDLKMAVDLSQLFQIIIVSMMVAILFKTWGKNEQKIDKINYSYAYKSKGNSVS